jgi:hypothetical protein
LNGTLELRQITGIHLKNSVSPKIKVLDHIDFFPDFLDVKIMIVLYKVKYTEKVAIQLIKQKHSSWKASDRMTFHLGPKGWSENLPVNIYRKEEVAGKHE